MRAPWSLSLLGPVASTMLLAGCLLKPATVTPRHFILAPISDPETSALPTPRLSVGVGYVKMPSLLLRDSLAVRTGRNEIEYLDNALWAERLDRSFQRTLATDLSKVLSSDSIYLADTGHDPVKFRIFVNVEQFDVDTSGRGTLIAQWRTTAADGETLLKSGCAKLTRTGPSPRGNPAAIAVTSSALVDEFSRELKPFILESVKLSSVGSDSAAIH